MADVISKRGLFLNSCGVRSGNSLSEVCKNHKAVGFGVKLSPCVKLKPLIMRSSSPLRLGSDFYGKRVVVQQKEGIFRGGSFRVSHFNVQGSLTIGKAQKWWEKGLQSSMREVTGAQDLVDSLLNAGDKLVVVDFFSPGCGGCRALHPKICQLAEMNPDVQFLQVNYEEHKSMCYSLNVHVLPFFRFYRGAHGRLCSFSCTNATIKKFKDALAKHTPDRCSIGPTKGLEEKELLALAANRDLSFTYISSPAQVSPIPVHEEVVEHTPPVLPLPRPLTKSKLAQGTKGKTLVTSGR